MNYLKVISLSVILALYTHLATAQDHMDQAKQAIEKKSKDLKAESQDKVVDLNKKGQQKIEGISEKANGIDKEVTKGTSEKINQYKGIKFENPNELSGAELGQARTKFAKEKANASVNSIDAMNAKASADQLKIDAAKQRLEQAKLLEGKDALTPEQIASKQAKIDAAQKELNGFKEAISLGTDKAKAAQEKISQLSLVQE